MNVLRLMISWIRRMIYSTPKNTTVMMRTIVVIVPRISVNVILLFLPRRFRIVVGRLLWGTSHPHWNRSRNWNKHWPRTLKSPRPDSPYRSPTLLLLGFARRIDRSLPTYVSSFEVRPVVSESFTPITWIKTCIAFPSCTSASSSSH